MTPIKPDSTRPFSSTLAAFQRRVTPMSNPQRRVTPMSKPLSIIPVAPDAHRSRAGARLSPDADALYAVPDVRGRWRILCGRLWLTASALPSSWTGLTSNGKYQALADAPKYDHMDMIADLTRIL